MKDNNITSVLHRFEDGCQLSLDTSLNEIYVFLDDDNGTSQGKPDNSVAIFARSFEKVDCRFFKRLIKTLMQKKAWAWHSSETGGTGFQHENDFRQIVKTLSRCKSRVFTFRRFESQLQDDEFLSDRGLESIEELLAPWREFWPVETNHMARLVFWSIRDIYHCLLRDHQPCSKPNTIVFYVDWMSFFDLKAAKRNAIRNLEGCFICFESGTKLGIEIRVISVFDKPKADHWIRAFLGLIDGECWIYGRFLRTKSNNVSAINKQGLAFTKLSNEEKIKFQFDLKSIADEIEAMTQQTGNIGKLGRKLKHYISCSMQWMKSDKWSWNGYFFSEHMKLGNRPKFHRWVSEPNSKVRG